MKTGDRYEGKACALCGKGSQNANLVSHAKNRTKIVRKPNLHVHHEDIEGIRVKMWLCAKCKRGMNRRAKGK